MPIDISILHNTIKNSFPEADIELKDTVGDSNHYELKITASEFRDMSKIGQHKLVHSALKGCLGNELHALSIKTYVK